MRQGNAAGRQAAANEQRAVTLLRLTLAAQQHHPLLLLIRRLQPPDARLVKRLLRYLVVVYLAICITIGVFRLATQRIAHEDVANAGCRQVADQRVLAEVGLVARIGLGAHV